MRDIKFRAWYNHPETSEEGVMFFVGDNYGTTHPLDCCRYAIDGQPVTLLQFTGLSDKNGVDIYEGDIVVISGYGDYECAYPFLELYEAATEDDIGIIKGNIYENKELLGE